MASNKKEIATELLPVLRVYKDGTVDRLYPEPRAPPSLLDPATGVSSKDVMISPEVSARFYLPKLITSQKNQKLPILVYFHGGAFCVGSIASSLGHHSLNSLVSKANVVAVSVGYRLAPEHPLPAAYEDCWTGLQWVASHADHNTIILDKEVLLNHENKVEPEPWLINHGDFDRVYLGGDSAGGNIVHNIAMRAGMEPLNCGVKITGAFLSFPYFLGSEPIGSEPIETHKESLLYRFWMLAYPNALGGIDNPMINPWAPGGPNLARIGCGRLFVCIGEKDKLRERGFRYCEELRESGWKGELEFVEVEGEDHIFHIFKPHSDKAKSLIKRMASFIV